MEKTRRGWGKSNSNIHLGNPPRGTIITVFIISLKHMLNRLKKPSRPNMLKLAAKFFENPICVRNRVSPTCISTGDLAISMRPNGVPIRSEFMDLRGRFKALAISGRKTEKEAPESNKAKVFTINVLFFIHTGIKG